MKEWFLRLCLVGAALLLCTGRVAMAEESFSGPLPAEIAAQMPQRGVNPGTVQDCVRLECPDGISRVFILADYGYSLTGWKLDNGQWNNDMSVTGLDYGDENAHFTRHQAGMERVPGLAWADDCGFDIVSPASGVTLSWHWDEGMYYAGWRDPAAWDGTVTIDWQGLTLRYYRPDGTVAETVTAETMGQMEEWVWYFPRKPGTPEAARALTALQRKTLEGAYPDWTMIAYDQGGSGAFAEGVYYRLEGDRLHLRMASFDLEGENGYTDLMPLPLSDAGRDRIAAGGAEDEMLSFLYGYWSMDYQDILDRAAVPIQGAIREADLKTDCLVLRTEEKGENRLYTVWTQDGQYRVSAYGKLPADFSLDTFHAGIREMILQWRDLSAGYRSAGEGEWEMSWLMTDTETYEIAPWGIHAAYSEREYWGAFPWLKLSSGNLENIPVDRAALAASLDREGWALVSNPDRNDRLHLRDKPGKSGASLGKFYNRTPVRVLEERGDWTRVRIGQEGRGLEGWMMTKYLAFGEEMDRVAEPRTPDLTLREEREFSPMFSDSAMARVSGGALPQDLGYRIIGVYEDKAYILLTEDGSVGYVPMDWMWPGNG